MTSPVETLTHFGTLYGDVVLYNVRGSSDDPKLGGSWKALLIRKHINGECHVSEPAPDPSGSSHPPFALGGPMTPNADGRVPNGGSCFLMPLCHWHNNTGRDGTPFRLRQDRA